MSNQRVLLALSDPKTSQLLERVILAIAGYHVEQATDWKAVQKSLRANPTDIIILSETLQGMKSPVQVKELITAHPLLPIILLQDSESKLQAIEAFQLGFTDCLTLPLQAEAVREVVKQAIQRRQQWEQEARAFLQQDTNYLRERLKMLETIQQVSRKVTSMLDLDSVLKAVVDAAVELTGAEEGSLLLLDEQSGELYMRAGRNFKEDFVQTFRLPVKDSLAGQVVRTGKPIFLDETSPQKIKTAYLVSTIIYMPIATHGQVIGVLEVDNRQQGKAFTEYHLSLVSALADYAAIAIENARLYANTELERSKLENILTNIEEGVIIIDQDKRLILMNRKAREVFGIQGQNWAGKRLHDVIQHQELIEVIRENKLTMPSRPELTLEDGRVFITQITPLPEIGLVITMQDITHLKELDRIKTDFVNTVSHDLRSPLTAILGYVELIDRVGSVNKQQMEFIRRIQLSVHNITALINDLLDLGRIEAGFDTRNEIVSPAAIAQFSVDGLRNRIEEKKQQLEVAITEDTPSVLGNPVRLKQMINNLLVNAIKYTQEGGKIKVHVRSENGQVILQVSDNGPGIPPADQPFIFDKFYRASNVPADETGTGLGLAIVKSIVESHSGRIWVESTFGEGTTFTVVLPVARKNLPGT